jgi:hypothetical protein
VETPCIIHNNGLPLRQILPNLEHLKLNVKKCSSARNFLRNKDLRNSQGSSEKKRRSSSRCAIQEHSLISCIEKSKSKERNISLSPALLINVADLGKEVSILRALGSHKNTN